MLGANNILPMAFLLNKHFVIWKLSMEIFANVIHPSWITLLGHQFVIEVLPLLQEELATTEVEPGARPHRGWNPFSAALAHFLVVLAHEVLPAREHAQPFLLTTQHHARRQQLLPVHIKTIIKIRFINNITWWTRFSGSWKTLTKDRANKHVMKMAFQ